ncbi:discoidin domain-containing protein [Thiolapillus sp.]|uniref:discoidin domain-containing protein n=1 Tax=Thiolapillus sp. TaxID=2017437 RepID=UPI003AF4BA75
MSLVRLGFLVGLAVLLCGADAGAAPGAVAQAKDRNILLMKNGGVILAHTGQYDKEFPVNAMIEGNLLNYWASGKPGPKGWTPQSFVIELDREYELSRLAVDNREIDEKAYPGVSAHKLRFSASTESSQSGWQPVSLMEAAQFGRKEKILDKPVRARWLKIEILSNYGNKSYTEINELEAYGKPVGDEPHYIDPNGVYRTNYQLLKLQVDGSRVTGCYELDKGYVHGTTNGRVFDIEWIEHKGEERGRALLVLSSGGGSMVCGITKAS